MKGDEDRVVDAFCTWLASAGWTTVRSRPGFNDVDVDATRDGHRLLAEVKGWAGNDMGTAMDICYGQLLRRMPPVETPSLTFALVVPDKARWHAERVDARVRGNVGIHLYLVSETGEVSFAAVSPDPSPRDSRVNIPGASRSGLFHPAR